MTDALERLIEAVKAGDDWPHAYDLWKTAIGKHGVKFQRIWAGTYEALSDAKALCAALLPDHDWGRAPGGQMWVQRPPAAPVWSGDGYPPARGLLLAILRAYANNVTSDQKTAV